MVFEIEKRSLFTSKDDFLSCESRVKAIGRFTKKYIYRSFLFQKPEYLRIRITDGKDHAVITEKKGDYHDIARKEINKRIKLDEISSYIDQLMDQGFTECVGIKAESSNYEVDGLLVSFNTIESLGMIVEVEALTEEECDIVFLEKKILRVMQKLRLVELDPDVYQNMMDNMYKERLKLVSEFDFTSS